MSKTIKRIKSCSEDLEKVCELVAGPASPEVLTQAPGRAVSEAALLSSPVTLKRLV